MIFLFSKNLYIAQHVSDNFNKINTRLEFLLIKKMGTESLTTGGTVSEWQSQDMNPGSTWVSGI